MYTTFIFILDETHVDGDVSAEVISVDFKGMVEEGKILAALHPQIVVNNTDRLRCQLKLQNIGSVLENNHHT